MEKEKNESFKEVIVRLLKKYGIKYKKVIYYKQSPYQKRRYKPEFVGEDVWVVRDGFPNVCFNSIDSIDENGSVEQLFVNVFDCK